MRGLVRETPGIFHNMPRKPAEIAFAWGCSSGNGQAGRVQRPQGLQVVAVSGRLAGNDIQRAEQGRAAMDSRAAVVFGAGKKLAIGVFQDRVRAMLTRAVERA